MINPISILHGFIKLALDEAGISDYSIQPNAVVRIDKCVACPLGGDTQKDKWDKVCKSCGCFMPAKVLVPNEKCPENKW